MPPLPPAPNVCRIALGGLTQGHPWANVFHLQYTGAAPTGVQLNGLCTSIEGLWLSALAPSIHTSVTLTQVIAQDLTNSSAATGLWTGSVAGTVAISSPCPVNVALCITWKTALRWRGGHPRMYLPGMVISNIVNGNAWLAGFQTSTQANAATWHTGLNSLTAAGNSWSHVVLRRHQTLADGSHVVLNPAQPYPILSGLVDSRVDSQRRRLGRDVAA